MTPVLELLQGDLPADGDQALLAADRGGEARTGSPWRLALSCAFALCLAAYAVARLLDIPGLALAAELAALVVGVGTSPLQLSRSPSLDARLAVGGLVGLSTAFLVGALLVLAPLWHPLLAASVVLLVAAAVHAAALPAALAEIGAWSRPTWRRRRWRAVVGRPSGLCTGFGTALWLACALGTGHLVPGIGGFLVSITPLWYVGVALVIGGIVLARHDPEPYAALSVTSLVLALTLTPALIYGMPRSQSAGKHIEIVQLILRVHRLHAGSGIYAAYSAFFAGIAWLCRLANVKDSLGVATFWPVVMGLIRIPALYFLFSQVMKGRYRRWAAITLVVLVDAIGADYFSPQAAGYVIGLGVLGVALAQHGRIGTRTRVSLIVVGGCAMAPTHELSPYLVGGVLAVLGVLRCVRPRLAALGCLAPAVIWALINHKVLGGYFSISSLGKLSNFAPPSTPARAGLTRDPIVGYSSHALLLGLLALTLLALVGFARHRRERWAWAYLVSAGVGLAFVAINPYGNEGIFRASLFAIPWLALLASFAVPRPSRLAGSAAWLALTVGLLATFLVAAFGMDGSGVMRRDDLNMLRVFNRVAPAGSYLLDGGFSDLPSSPPTLQSIHHLLAFGSVDQAAFQDPGHPTPADLDAMLWRYQRIAQAGPNPGDPALYVVWSPVSTIYAKEYALALPSQANAWRRLFLTGPRWRLVYAQNGSYLFRAIGRVAEAPAAAR